MRECPHNACPKEKGVTRIHADNRKTNGSCSAGGFKTMCGGQALIEGIMMRGPKKQAIVVRKPDGELAIRESRLKFIKDRYPVLGTAPDPGGGDVPGLYGGGRQGPDVLGGVLPGGRGAGGAVQAGALAGKAPGGERRPPPSLWRLPWCWESAWQSACFFCCPLCWARR